MITRYSLWLLPSVLMALVAACALGFWGGPLGGDPGGDFSGIEFGLDDDVARAAAIIDRPGLPIEIGLDAKTFSLMCRLDNREIYKDRAVNVTVAIGEEGEVRRHGVMTLRGRGSLRKSSAFPNYDVKLIRPVEFSEGVEMKRLFLMNLYYDRHHMEMPVAYRLLAELGLFPLHFQFVRLEVAGENHGVYLLVEPPVSGLRRNRPDCVGVFRRVRPNGYDVEWTASVPGVRTSLNRLRSFVAGESAGGELGISLDEQQYFRWLAVNALLKNVDSLDELFLYECRPTGRGHSPLQVLAWDYDDIIDSEMKKGGLRDPLLYGSLAPLEHKVAADAEIYDRYSRFLSKLLADELAMDKLEKLVLEVQSQRDGLDDGESAVDQRRSRNKRAAYTAEMLSHLRENHRELSSLSKHE